MYNRPPVTVMILSSENNKINKLIISKDKRKLFNMLTYRTSFITVFTLNVQTPYFSPKSHLFTVPYIFGHIPNRVTHDNT